MGMDRTRSTDALNVPMPGPGQMILAAGEYYPFNDYTSGLNDNVLVVGGSGTGKTRSVVRPNILQATGSYIISDPKGNLYDKYRSYLLSKGYRVERLDFVQPECSTVKYNFFEYLCSDTDVLKIVHMLSEKAGICHRDIFWDQSAEILMECIVSYLQHAERVREKSLGSVIKLLRGAGRHELGDREARNSAFDMIMKEWQEMHPTSLSARAYESIAMNPVRTWNCIVTAAAAKYAAYDTKEIRELLSEDTVHFERLGREKTALFVVVSDCDRSMDTLVNVFFSQCMQELCRQADADGQAGNRLRIPVRFILDDFATNVRIDQFPRMISSIRSRGISVMLMVQAEAQLESGYGSDAGTIISNCDSYVYLGGNDVRTARAVGERCDLPMLSILNMPVGSCWVFRRGQEAHLSQVFPMKKFERRLMNRRRTKPVRVVQKPDAKAAEQAGHVA